MHADPGGADRVEVEIVSDEQHLLRVEAELGGRPEIALGGGLEVPAERVGCQDGVEPVHQPDAAQFGLLLHRHAICQHAQRQTVSGQRVHCFLGVGKGGPRLLVVEEELGIGRVRVGGPTEVESVAELA